MFRHSIIIFLVLGGCLSAFTVYGQFSEAGANEDLNRILKKNLNKVSPKYRNDRNFKKAYNFFISYETDSAIVYADKYIHSKNRNSQLVSYAHFFRGSSLMQEKLIEDALNEFEKIPEGFVLSPLVKFEKASLQMTLGRYEAAIELYREIEGIEDFGKYAMSRGSATHNIGLCYMYLEEFEQSETYLLESIEINSADKDTVRLIGCYGDIANLYYNQYLDNKAIPFFVKAYDLSTKVDVFELKRDAAFNMAIVEENRGDLEKSLEYRKEYDKWKDSTSNQEKVWELAQIEKHELRKTKQREIELLERKNSLVEREKELKSKERNAILIGAGVLLFVLVLIIYFYYQKIRSSAIIAEQRESLDKLNAFKNRLFSIVSHDLRSSVHGLRRSTEQLREEIPSEDSKLKSLVNQQGAIANSTYGMLDNLLNWALLQSDEIYFHPEKISLKRLIPQVVLNYQPLLDQKQISLEVDVPVQAKVNADNDSVKIVLRNVLDNAMKFTPENGNLSIVANVGEDFCELRIKDSGPGMTPEQLAMVVEQSSQVSKESGEERSGTGLGVRLCASFMSKNNGSFHMESEEGQGTTVVLRFEKA